MADDITDVYVATEAGDAGWQSLSALAAEQVEAELPISSADSTVILESPSANTFSISTNGKERLVVGSGGQVLVGLDAVENANFNMHVAGDDNVQICIDATDEDAIVGSVFKLRTGDKKYWNFQHSQNVVGSLEKNQFIITNGSGTFLRGYQDNTALFGGSIKTLSVSGLAANDASIELNAAAVIKSETSYVQLNSNQNGWNNKLNVTGNNFNYNTGTVNQESNRYVKESDGTQTQVVKEGVYGLTTSVNDWGAKEGHTLFKNLAGPHVIQAEQHVRLITQDKIDDPSVTDPTAGVFLASSSDAGQQAQLTTSQSGVVCIDTSVQLQTQAAPNSQKRTRLTVKDQEVVSEVDIKTSRISGLDANDASVGLGANLTVSTGGEGRVVVDGSGHVGINKSSPRSNTMLEVVSDATSPFCLILDATEAAGVYEGRSGIRQYGTGGTSSIFEYAIDNTNGTYMFSGGSAARSTIIKGDEVADILVKPNDYVRLTPEVRTARIVGSQAPDSDASINLGASATITVSGNGVFQVSNSGNVKALYLSPTGEFGIGRTPSTGVALDVYQPTSGARFQSTLDNVNSRIIIQEGSLVDEQFSFDRYGTNFTGNTTGSIVPKSAVIRNEADASLVITTGGSNTSENNAIQLRPGASNVNVNGYALKAHSDKTVEIPGQVQTPRIVGPADSNASIELGPELLTNNHTPTQPNSIATVKYVLDNASSYDDTDIKAQLNSEQISRTAGDAELQRQLDQKIWVGTTFEYNNLSEKNEKVLYCLTD